MFDEHRNLKFEKSLRRLSTKKKETLIQEFEVEFEVDGRGRAAENYQKQGLKAAPVYALFRGWAAEKILGRKVDFEFEAFMESKGHPVLVEASGKFKLKRPILTETN